MDEKEVEDSSLNEDKSSEQPNHTDHSKRPPPSKKSHTLEFAREKNVPPSRKSHTLEFAREKNVPPSKKSHTLEFAREKNVSFADNFEDIPLHEKQLSWTTTQKKIGPLGRKRLRSDRPGSFHGLRSNEPLVVPENSQSHDSKVTARQTVRRPGIYLQKNRKYSSNSEEPATPLNSLKSLVNVRRPSISWKYHTAIDKANSMDTSGLAPLHIAAQCNDVTRIHELIHKGADVNIKTISERLTPLHIAARYNCPNAAEELMQYGADSADALTNGQTALHVCCRRGFLKVAKVLIQKARSDVNSRDKDESTPLHQATIKGNIAMCTYLVENGADIRALDINQVSPLMQAAQGGFKECVQYLMSLANQNGINLKEYLSDTDNEGNTALHLAVSGRHIAIARALIERGAPPNCRRTTNGFTPLHQAAIIGEEALVQMLIDKGAQTEMTDNEQMTPLHRAALYNRVETILLLIRQGLYLDSRDEDNFTPLMCAAWKGQSEAGRSLLRYGADIKAVDKEMKSCLHWAVEMQHLEFANMLFEHGHCGEEIINWKDRREQTALHYAAEVGNIKALNLLIDMKAGLVVKDSEERTPLHIASESGNLECVEALLQACPVPLNDDDIDDMTPLLLASQNGHHRVVKFLIKMGADMSSRNDDRRSSVHLAAKNNKIRVLHMLIENNANVNAIDKDKNTPLHLCAQAGHAETTSLLLNSGADVRLQNVYGKYPLDVAIEHKQEGVAKAMLSGKSWEVAMNNCDSTSHSPMRRLIAILPEAALQVLNQCVTRSHDDIYHPDLKVTYDYRYIDPGPDDITYDKHKTRYFALETMVDFKREKLLSHDLSQTSMTRKWKKFARYFSYTDFIFYLTFVILISVYLRANLPIYNNVTDRDEIGCPILKFDNTSGVNISNDQTWPDWMEESRVAPYLVNPNDTVYHLLIWDETIIGIQLFIGAFISSSVIYELINMFTQKLAYFKNWSNLFNWSMFLPTYLFVFPPFEAPCDYNWVCGTIAVFGTWMNFIFVLNRFDFFGLYVTMFFTTLKSLIKAMSVYIFFIIAFALAFFICFQSSNESFRTEWTSVVTTFVMTLGEINKGDLLDTGEDDLYPFEEVANGLVVIFLFLMPMVLVNLTIGISVGDIEQILESSYVKRLSAQVKIIIDTEKKFPRWLQRKIWQPRAEFWPNRKKDSFLQKILVVFVGASGTKFLLKTDEESKKKEVTVNDVMAKVTDHETILTSLTMIIHQQGELLRRIGEKHDIITELDDPFSAITNPSGKGHDM